ncbi:MAG TPA: aspartyl protease family protein [Polyangia bacterium]|jgi:hypothetical protein
MSRALLALAVAGLAACGDGAPADFPPPRAALHPLDGQLLYPVHVDDRPSTYWFVIDTGAIKSAADETLVRDLQNGVGRITLDLGAGIVVPDLEVFAADLSPAVAAIGVPIHGLIGQDLFPSLYFGLDYRRREVTAAPAIPRSAPPGFHVADAVPVPYTLEQLLPIVEVPIGGHTARLIADTGSGVTLLTESFVSPELLAGALGGYTWRTSYGSDPGRLVRLPALAFGAATVTDEWAVVVPDDHHLRPVFDALGLRVDGFLGYPVYRHFYLGVDGAASRYVAYPYPNADHLDAHEWDRVGVELRREAGAVVIDMVLTPSGAADAGVVVGDILESVDDAPLDTSSLDDVRLLLRGAPGETRTLRLTRGAAPLTLAVTVDRLLPPR